MGVTNKPRGQVPTNRGLLHRRYSVPETVMRKYSLTKQQSSSSDSGVATVPVETPGTISSNPTTQPESSYDEATAVTPSPDLSDHSSGKMGNRTGKRTPSPVPSESTTNAAPARSTLDTVSEETSESVSGKVSEGTSEHPSSLKSDSKLGRTSDGVSSSTPMKHLSPQNTAGSAVSQVTVRGDMSSVQTVAGDNRPASASTEGEQHGLPNTSESIEPPSIVKYDLSSSQSPESESANNSPSSALNTEAQTTAVSTEPQSAVTDDVSSSQTPGLESFGSRSSTFSNGTYQSSRNNNQTVEPQSVLLDEISATPTTGTEACDSRPQPVSNKDSIQSPYGKGNTKEKLNNSRRDPSTHSYHAGSTILHPAEETAKPHISSRVHSSSSKTVAFASKNSSSSTSEWSAGNGISTVEFCSPTSTVTPDGPLLQSYMTRSWTARRDTSCTPTERCVNTPNPEPSQSSSATSDRASESCSITPMESSSSPERPSVAMGSLVSSASPPSSDHTISTQDTTLSVRSHSTVLDRPASVVTKESTDNIEFTNDSSANNSKVTLNILGGGDKSESAQANLQLTGDSGHTAQPNSEVGRRCIHTHKNNSKIRDKVEPPSGSIHLAKKQASTSTKSEYYKHKSRSCEATIQPTMMQINLAKCPDDGLGIKETVSSSQKQEAEFYGSKTYLVIGPNSSVTSQVGARFCDTTVYPPPKSRFSPGVQPEASSHEVENFTPAASEESEHYGWSRLTDEEHTVQLQLQRHRLWMNRKVSAANALSPPPTHGPVSSCVGTGSTYRKSYDVQLVVPRYSALPRSVSMLVNTSSGECSSNSNSDSECLSLVDSLEERPSSCTSKHKPMKHDLKPVRGDIDELLPEERNHKYDLHRRINAATPRGKGKAFFVSMETGLDEESTVKAEEHLDRHAVSQSMPDRLKKKLSQRHQQINIKKKIKRQENKNRQGDINTEKDKNIWSGVDTGGLVNVQALAETQRTENKHALTDTSHSEHKIQEEAKATEENSPIRLLEEKSSAELPPHKKTQSTAIFHTVAQGNSGGGTIIVSRNEGQGQKEQKLLEQNIPVDASKCSSTGNMKKEQMSDEHSPPVKRFKASKHKYPRHKDQETTKQMAVKNLQNGVTLHKEKKHDRHQPLLKTSNCSKVCTTEQEERKSFEQEAGANTANSTVNGGKEQERQKYTEECTTGISAEVEVEEDEVKPMTNITSQEISTVPVDPNVITEQRSEVQRHPTKAETGFRRKMQQRHTFPKESKTENSPRHDDDESKSDDPSSPEETLLNETYVQSEDNASKAEKLAESSMGNVKDSPSSETSESIPKYTEKLEIKKTNCAKLIKPNIKAKNIDNEVDVEKSVNKSETQQAKAETTLAESKPIPDVTYQKREHQCGSKVDKEKSMRSKAPEKFPEKTSLSTVSCQTSPDLKCEEERNSAPSNKEPQLKNPELPLQPTRNLFRTNLPLKSSIPIMKSPIATRKLSPDTVITLQQPLQNSNLPVHKPSRLIHDPPIRQSAPLLGNKFHQRFEVIPEERSGSLEYSTEDQSCLSTDRKPRPSLPVGQASRKVSTGNSLHSHSKRVSHSCLGLDQATNKYRQKSYGVANSETSSSIHEDISNGNVSTTASDITRKVIQRPTCQSRIPRAEKMKRQSKTPEYSVCKGQEQRKDYQGKAALAPHIDDKDLVTLSKGWINFYLLKDGRGTPDSSCGEAPSDLSDKEKKLSWKKCSALPRTVTVVGGDDSRIRQYTVQSHLPPHERDKNKQEPTILPELINNSSMRRTSVISVQKLPVTLLEPNNCTEDSDHSTAYLCLPNPQLNATSLLEGSGELACSESSVSSSSDSESDQATRAAMLPIRWPTRQPHRGPPHHWSRPWTKHYKPERFQSHNQSGGGGSAGWTVTVAGSNSCPQQPPELEMHFSFPSCVRRPGASQSDSGLGEDNNGDKPKKQQQKGDDKTQLFLPPAHSANETHHLTLTVKNQGGSEKLHEISKSGKRTYQGLPELRHNPSQSKNSKKALKRPESCFPVTSITEEDTRKSNKFSLLWPKVKKIIESKVIIRKSIGHISQEVKSISQLLENDDGGIVLRSGLAIEGSAITPERKPRVPTMSERDLTRSQTAKH